MDNNLTLQIQARMEELPEDVRRAIESNDVDKKVQGIGTKHKLHIDQTELLDNETRLVMLGFADPGDFATQIAEQLHVSQEQSEAIAQDISTELFLPIRESMQEFMEERVLEARILEEKSEQPAFKREVSEREEKSVIMPSSVAVPPAAPKALAPTPPTPVIIQKPTPAPVPTPPPPKPPVAPVQTISTPAPVSIAPLEPAPTPVAQPQPAPVPPPPTAPAPAPIAPPKPAPSAGADVMLQETTVSLPKKESTTPPPPYKADPYREPPE